MNNSVISKSSSSKLKKRLSHQSLRNSKSSVKNIEQQNQKAFTVSHQSMKHINIFTPLKMSPQRHEQPLRIFVNTRNQSNQEQKSTPLFHRPSRQEKCIEPDLSIKNPSTQKQHNIDNLNKQLLETKLTFKQSFGNRLSQYYQDQNLEVHSMKSLETIHRDQTLKQSIIKKNTRNQWSFHDQKCDDHNLPFGQGLEGIDKIEGTTHQIKQFDNVKLKTFSNNNPSQQKVQSSTFSPLLSNISKQSNRKTLQIENRSTGHSFFKRQLSSSCSQSYLKSYHQEQSRNGFRQSNFQGKLSINSYKQRGIRGSLLTNNRSSSRNHNDSSCLSRNQYLPTFNETYQGILNRKQATGLSMANNLNQLLFKYNGGHATTLYNYRLKIKNESSFKLAIKITCTSPRHYVRLCSQVILQPASILKVPIQLKLFPHDLDPTTMKHDLSRYKNDKFKIIYWTYECSNDSDYTEGEKVLPVIIEETAEQKHRNQGLTRNINDNQIRQVTEEKEVQMYKKFIQKNNFKAVQMNGRIIKLQSQRFKHEYFNKHLFMFFVMIGIGIGFWLG